MSKELVIVDVDDVLLELNASVVDRINKMGYPDLKVENIVSFDLNKSIDVFMLPVSQQGLQDNGLGCPRDLIMQCYSEVESFAHASLTENFYEGLKLLSEEFNTLIHTNNFNLEIAKFKIELFERLCSDLDLNFNFCVGKDKPAFTNVYAVFEDCVGNIVKYSDSCRKILIDRTHNRELFNGKLLSEATNLHRAKNFYDGVEYLLKER